MLEVMGEVVRPLLFKKSDKELKSDLPKKPFETIGLLIPKLMFHIILFMTIIGFGSFIIHGGYSQELQRLGDMGDILAAKTSVINVVINGFTSEAVRWSTSGFLPAVWKVLFGIECVIILIHFYRNTSKVKIILMSVFLILTGCFTVLFYFAYKYLSLGGLNDLPEETQMKVYNFL